MLRRVTQLLDYVFLASATPFLLAATAISVPVFYQIEQPASGRGELDSVAIYVAPNPNQSMLLVTDKSLDRVEIHDADSNHFLGSLGGSGSQDGRLSRPNGIAVAYGVPTGAGDRDLLLVVERDNNRVSVFAFPYLFFMGSFGTGHLQEPYGIALHWTETGLQAWVTSTGQKPDQVVVFDILPSPSGVDAAHVMSFPTEPGSVLESIVIDPHAQRALVCDEGQFNVMVYDLFGNFLGRFGEGLFTDDPEGIVIYNSGEGGGYIIVSDQNASPTQYEVFDRRTYDHIGHFSGTTEGTDGIALTQLAMPNLPQGALFAVHVDQSVHAYDWQDIASQMGLCIGECPYTSDAGDTPRAGRILANHPNPFNPTTHIRFTLDSASRVRLDIFDLEGRRVRELVQEHLPAGPHEVLWDGRDDSGARVGSGTYFARLLVDNSVFSHKLTLLK